MVTVERNGHSDPSLNAGQGYTDQGFRVQYDIALCLFTRFLSTH